MLHIQQELTAKDVFLFLYKNINALICMFLGNSYTFVATVSWDGQTAILRTIYMYFHC